MIALFSYAWSDAQIIKREDIETPLLSSEPFDLITVTADSKEVLLRIAPVPNVTLPFPAEGDLVFEFSEQSESLLQIPFKSIKKYESYNDLVLLEANEFLKKRDYTKAFRNLLYLYDNGGKDNPQLVNTLRNTLFQDAKKRFESGDYELALSIFEDLYQDKPDFRVPGINRSLSEIIIASYDGILKQKFEDGRYDAIRETVKQLETRYGSAASKLTQGWERRFEDKANRLLAESKELANAGKGREAHVKAKQAERTKPGLKAVEEVQEQLMDSFPLIVVGVSQTSDQPDPLKIDDWAARRIGRLTRRSMVEIDGLSDEGARYNFLNGTISRTDDLGLVYAIDIDPEKQEMGVPKISAIQVANRLLSIAHPESPSFDPTWRRILKSVELASSTRVVITLQRPFVRPEALMQVAFPVSESSPEENGVYKLTNKDETFLTFEINPIYPRSEQEQHPVIIEQLFPSDAAASDALIRGEIDVVDRIPPADLNRLKETPNVQVRPYVVPTVHMLIPKIRGKLAGNYRFRNALSTAIPRESIVIEVIGNGNKIEGCDPITGPFPLGGDDNDQISYGYDLRIKPLQFSEKLSMTLTEIAKKKVKMEKEKRPSIVLAHPSGSTARSCAEAIARYWNDVNIKTTLRPLAPGVTTPPDNQWDVLYAEVFIEEPLIDSVRLFGGQGLTDDIAAPAEQSLRNVVTSQTWQGACLALRNIHRQVSVDLSIIPLYQVQEHYAFRDNVYEIGRNLVHLYQNADRWNIETFSMAQRRKAEENER